MNILEMAMAAKMGGGSGGDGMLTMDTLNPNRLTPIGNINNLSATFSDAVIIEEKAFGSEENLIRIDLPRVITIGDWAFANCKNLAYVRMPNVESIGENAFENVGLKRVDISHVKNVGTNAFTMNKNLVHVSLNSNTIFGEGVFLYCPQLNAVSGLTEIETIPKRMFSNCTSFSLGDGYAFPKLTSIGESAFFRCSSLRKIIAVNLTTIGESAFYGCSELDYVHFPALTNVSEQAFRFCTALQTIKLDSAHNIEAVAFEGCTNLTAIIIPTTETVCVCDFSALNDTPIQNLQGHIYVPASMYEHYRAGYADALDAAYAEMGVSGAFDIMFRKIEDYPEICG